MYISVINMVSGVTVYLAVQRDVGQNGFAPPNNNRGGGPTDICLTCHPHPYGRPWK